MDFIGGVVYTGRPRLRARSHTLESSMNAVAHSSHVRQSPEVSPESEGCFQGADAIPGTGLEPVLLFEERDFKNLSAGNVHQRDHAVQSAEGLTPMANRAAFQRSAGDPPPDPSPDCAHDVSQWSYAMEAIYPRAYGRCWRCQRLVIVCLPRKLGWAIWGPDSHLDNELARAKDAPHRYEIAAIETFLKEPGNRHHPYSFFDTGVTGVNTEFVEEIRHRAVVESHKLVEPLEARANLLRAEINLAEITLAELRRQAERMIPAAVRQQRKRGYDVIGSARVGIAFVYALVSSEDIDTYRYIGSTSSPGTRLASHLSERAHPKVREWVASVQASGHFVEMLRLWEGIGRGAAFEQERRLIASAVARGMCDLNTSGVPSRALPPAVTK